MKCIVTLFRLVGMSVSIITLLYTLISCQSTSVQQIEGDLYFKLVNFRVHELPDSVLTAWEKGSDLAEDTEGKAYVDFLIQHNLLRSPFIQVKQESGEVLTVYLDKKTYESFQEYTLQGLQDSKQTVRLALKAEQLEGTNYQLQEIVSTKVQSGEVPWAK